MSCTEVITFYRVCGHIHKGFRHSDPCLQARVGSGCWNPLPPKFERHYVVEHCLECLRRLVAGMSARDAQEFQAARSNPASRLHDLGENPQIINPGKKTDWQMLSLATIARIDQEEYESCTRTQQSIQNNKPNELLVEARAPFEDNTCTICQEDLEQEDVKDGQSEGLPNLSRSLPCGHVFHHPCIELWLISSDDPACPWCRKQYHVVCLNGHDDPVYRWYPETSEYRQISGHVPFPEKGRGGMKAYKWDEKPDRWGDLLVRR
ncbi:hypothetical protein DL98DRAFT_525606 [Cadophora sp. DSE1049]|nr:hypothetical protein DL98DRAFT_525606 [Cadophora sp. DSE1049]